MSFWEILDTILLKPLQLIFETAYMIVYKMTDSSGMSIIILSLFVNFLALPLYMRADAIQEEERKIEKKLQKGVDHIKKTFNGDERMMMMQTYYRQNHYKPVYVLRSAVSLFLQIPFFIAAYRFLSGLELLRGVSFWLIPNLGKPDGMLQIGGITINVLPIIMTAVNLVSCVIFTKGSPLKSKLQLYVMALFFLVFLYTSPAGLVFYWTLNNIFSLVKTIFYKLKNPGKTFVVLLSTVGGILVVYGMFFYHYRFESLRRKALLVAVGILLQLPVLYRAVKGQMKKREFRIEDNRKLFFAGVLFLTVLTGALIPSAVIKASPQEFVDITNFYHPLWYIVSSFCIAFGIFVFWTGIFYYLAKPSVRAYFARGIWVISGVAVINYMFPGKDPGMLTSHLQFENELCYTMKEIGLNTAVVFIVIIVLWYLCKKYSKVSAEILMAGVLAFSVMTVVNIAGIREAVSNINSLKVEEEGKPQFTLSRRGKNVIVLMLDRAMGEYIPYIFQEKPELEEKFSGFTYYSNMLSFGMLTNFSTPSLFGGYEYTPIELNRRDTELLADKHDEALKVMPALFEQNGYKVTVIDPPYAGYQWASDLSIYDDYSGIKAYLTGGKFVDPAVAEQGIRSNKRNFFCYSIFKTAPMCFQELIYDRGGYNQAELEINYTTGQKREGSFIATGVRAGFIDSYNVLTALPDITEIADEENNTFLVMANNATHEPMLLQEPDYVPAMRVNNMEYSDEYADRFTVGGKTLQVSEDMQLIHYHVNMAAMLRLGEWFDYMRENGVYDNTRIIIVSDHGTDTYQQDGLVLEDGFDIERNYALLMVKDFDSEGFETSEEFMTCADVPALAVEDVIEEPINPFTGEKIGHGDKAEKEQYVIISIDHDIYVNNGTQFLPARWYAVQDDMRKPENWKLVAEDAVLTLKD